MGKYHVKYLYPFQIYYIISVLYIMKLLIEATVVGIATVIIGSIVGFILGKGVSTNLPKICKIWNKNHIMELCLFLTGFILHIVCEYLRINKWYCTNGNACKK